MRICTSVCVFKSIQIQPGWRRPSQAEEKPWREWISNESVRLIWPARGEIQQLCLDMMNCMCRTRVFTEQTTGRQKKKKKKKAGWKREYRSEILLFLTNTLWKNATTKSLCVAERFERRSNQDNSSERAENERKERERENASERGREREAKWEKCTAKCEKERANEVRKPLQWFDNRKNA